MKRILIVFLIILFAAPAQAGFFSGGGSPSSATTSAAGISELATDAETAAGTATDKVLTPSNLTGMGLLPLGTAGQVLRVNSGADALEYGTVSSTVPIGHLSGLVVSRKDDDEVYVSGGSIDVGGKVYTLSSQVAGAPGGAPLGYSDDLIPKGWHEGGGASSQDGSGAWQLAFDDNEETGWFNYYTATYPHWIQWKLPSSRVITRISWSVDEGLYGNKGATSWGLYGSNAGTFTGEETLIFSVSDDDVWEDHEVRVWDFDNSTAFRYYRLIATEGNGNRIYVAELQAFEPQYTFSASTLYYVYVDPPASGTTLSASNIIISGTAPEFDSAKGGYYNPTFTDQRAIAHFTTDASGHVPTAPFVHYQPLPAVSSGAQLLSVTNLPLNADGETTIYTVPAGVRCVLSYAILVAGADAGSTDLTIGADGAETDWLGTQQLDNLDAENDAVMLMPVPNATPVKIKSYAAGTVLKAAVANQAGGATNTLYLYGILY